MSIGQRMTLADVAAEPGPRTESFPAVLDRLHREQFTGETVLCWAQGYPKVLKFVTTTDIRLDTGREKA